MCKYLIVFLLLISIIITVDAQNQTSSPKETSKDSINLHKDSIISKPFTPKVKQDHKKYHPDSLHNPHKAVIRSLILPGLGQVYNHQWWKVPLIYTALGLLGDAYFFNQRYYREFLALSIYKEGRISPPLPGSKYYNDYVLYQGQQTQTIYNIKDAYRRDRDLCIMGFAAFWGIQVIDAYIDAKFKHSYTMDTDFSYNVGPTIINQSPMYVQSSNSPIIPGIKLTFTLR
ncbi:DUF5683 domain-containing protein [Mucilaginibacter sp.]